MKKFFKIVAIICTIIVMGVLAFSAYALWTYNHESGKLETETMALAAQSVKAIAGSWEPAELQKRAHPRLIGEMKKQNQNLDDFFKVYRKLGALESDPQCKMVNFKSNMGIPTFTLVDYNCDAVFENDKATVAIELMSDKDSNNTYMITVFRIESPLFMKLLGK